MASSLCFRPLISSPRLFSHQFRDRRREPPALLVRASATGGGGRGAAVVWLKRDLRVDDHLGFVDAVKENPVVVPVYVFDRRILSS